MATEDKVSVPSEEQTKMPKRKSKWPNTPSKWIKLLGTPLTILIALGGLIWGVLSFNAQQSASAQMQATQVATTQKQTLDQQHQATLDGYLDDMSNLLLMSGLRTAKQGSEVQVLSQARTYEAVRNLDGARKGTLVRFLWEAGLLNGSQSIIRLNGADLSSTDLSGINVSGTNASGLISCSILSENCAAAQNDVNLSGANLSGANLSGANLSDAILSDAILSGADLSGANLSGADLSGATVTSNQLAQAKSLAGATMPDRSKHP